MKRSYTVALVLLVITWVFTAAVLMLMPDTVPAHYNAAGEVDRFGSKYEQLILPIFISLVTVGMLVSAKRKQIHGQERSLLRTCILLQGVLLALFVYFALRALWFGALDAPVLPDVWRFTAALLGFVAASLGIVLRDVPRNRFFGLRTRWSLSSEKAWQKSQRFAANSGLVSGGLILLSVCFCRGVVAGVLGLGLLLVWVVLGVVASYRFAHSA